MVVPSETVERKAFNPKVRILAKDLRKSADSGGERMVRRKNNRDEFHKPF